MKNKPTIVIFNGFYLPHLGGVERYTSNLVEKLKKYYHIIIVTSNDSSLKEYEVINGIEIYRLPVYNVFKNRYPIIKKDKVYKRIMKELPNNKIKHIICNTRYYQTSIIGSKFAKKNNIDLSVIDHSSNHISVGNKILDYIGSIYEHYLTYIIKKSNPRFYGVSKKCNEWLKHFKVEANGVFYNSIDDKYYDNYYKRIKNKKMIISYIGRILPEKGIYNLLECNKFLQEKYHNYELIIAGDGPILKDIINTPNITFLGKISHEEVIKLCNKSDIFVYPSMYPEGLPTSILEAGLMKTAVVATDRGGTKEIIYNNKLGLIIEDNVEDLYEKLCYLLDNPDKIEMFKNNIHHWIINNFTWDKTAKSIYKELKKYE